MKYSFIPLLLRANMSVPDNSVPLLQNMW